MAHILFSLFLSNIKQMWVICHFLLKHNSAVDEQSLTKRHMTDNVCEISFCRSRRVDLAGPTLKDLNTGIVLKNELRMN